MGKVLISGGAGGGVSSDDTTTIAAHVLEGDTYLGSDTDDEAGTGTMTNVTATETAKSVVYTSPNIVMRMTNGAHITNASSGYPEVQIAASNFGDATTAYVYKGKKFTSSAGLNLTGAMTVNSLLSFSVAASSGRQVTATWKNPTAAAGKPYSGVYIRYSTSSSPGTTGGTQIYKGSGSNTSSGGTSSVSITLPNLSTTYYLSAYPYVTCSVGEMIGSALNATVTTSGTLSKTFTSGTTYTIPAGYTKMDIFCVGGGGGGGAGTYTVAGGGGGGGYTKTVTGTAISSGQSLTIVVGAGGTGATGGSLTNATTSSGSNGGSSSVTRSGTTLCTAAGGNGAIGSSYYGGRLGGSGGSGGGTSTDASIQGYYSPGGTGGSNGSAGYRNGSLYSGDSYGKGQGTTTIAFAASSGTKYSGGGGAGCVPQYRSGDSEGGYYYQGCAAGSGGTSGGGAGGGSGSAGSAGSANTGGGGGGSYGNLSKVNSSCLAGGTGGSGVVMIKLY